jgi:hypothetical protein
VCVKIPDARGLPRGVSLSEITLQFSKNPPVRFEDVKIGATVSFSAKLVRKKPAIVHTLNISEGVEPVHPFYGVGSKSGNVEIEVGPIEPQEFKIEK